MPAISVIMSVKNGLPYIGETIRSVLNQSFTDFEFIIVDDGSTDSTAEVVRSFNDERIHLIQQENTGVATAKNKAIQQSGGKYIAIIDADDIWLEDKLQSQFNFLEANPDHVAVGGFSDVIDMDGTYVYTEKKPVTDSEIRTHQEQRNPWSHSAVMYTRAGFDAVGGYYEPVKQYIVDYMIMYQLSLHGKVHQLPQVVMQYRIVPTSLSAKANNKLFDEITHRSIRSGSMTDKDLRLMLEMKSGQDKTPEFKKSMYHLYMGRSFLFHNFKRSKSITHLKTCLALNPSVKIARYYLWMARLLPQFAVKLIYNRLSPIAGSTYVRK